MSPDADSFLANEIPVGSIYEITVENWYNPVLYEAFEFYVESYWFDGADYYVIDRFRNLVVDQSNAAAVHNLKLTTSVP